MKSYHNSTREVDLHDQLWGHYAISNKSRKWRHYLFWFCLDVELWTLLFWRKKAINHPSRTHLAFHIELTQNLIGEFSNRRRTTRPGQSEDGHWPIALSKGQCKRCLKHRKTTFCRMGCQCCSKRICLVCFPNHIGDLFWCVMSTWNSNQYTRRFFINFFND